MLENNISKILENRNNHFKKLNKLNNENIKNSIVKKKQNYFNNYINNYSLYKYKKISL